MVLAKEQHATSGDVIFWYIADPSKTPNSKSYSGNAIQIHIRTYPKNR